MSELSDIKHRMAELIDFIRQANDKITSGTMVDLVGLDDEVASLCDRTLALHPTQAITVQPVMAEMISELEDLGRSLESFRSKMNKG